MSKSSSNSAHGSGSSSPLSSWHSSSDPSSPTPSENPHPRDQPLFGPRSDGLVLPPPTGIPDWAPQPYSGPVAKVVGQARCFQSKILDDKFACKDFGIHRDETHEQTIIWYNQFENLPNRGAIRYSKRGYFVSALSFDQGLFKEYLINHPLGSSLQLRLERCPRGLESRYSFKYSTVSPFKCRSRLCPRIDGKIRPGEARVAFEEVLPRLPKERHAENDPWFAAGYLHLNCLEKLMDLRQLFCEGLLDLDYREYFPNEPEGRTRENNIARLKVNISLEYREQLKRYIQNPMYKPTPDNMEQGSFGITTWWYGGKIRRGELDEDNRPEGLSREVVRKLKANQLCINRGWGGNRQYGEFKNLRDWEKATRSQEIKNSLQVACQNSNKAGEQMPPPYLGPSLIRIAQGYMKEDPEFHIRKKKKTPPKQKKKQVPKPKRAPTPPPSDSDEFAQTDTTPPKRKQTRGKKKRNNVRKTPKGNQSKSPSLTDSPLNIEEPSMPQSEYNHIQDYQLPDVQQQGLGWNTNENLSIDPILTQQLSRASFAPNLSSPANNPVLNKRYDANDRVKKPGSRSIVASIRSGRPKRSSAKKHHVKYNPNREMDEELLRSPTNAVPDLEQIAEVPANLDTFMYDAPAPQQPASHGASWLLQTPQAQAPASPYNQFVDQLQQAAYPNIDSNFQALSPQMQMTVGSGNLSTVDPLTSMFAEYSMQTPGPQYPDIVAPQPIGSQDFPGECAVCNKPWANCTCLDSEIDLFDQLM